MLFSESSARDRSDLTFRNVLEKNANSILNCLPVAESQLGKVFTKKPARWKVQLHFTYLDKYM